MVKLILFDIDGTLRDECLGIHKNTFKALDLCRQQDIMLGICTGRTAGVIPQEVLEIGFEVIISGGGNVITVNDEVIKEVYFKPKLIKLFQELFDDYPYSIETPNGVYMNEGASLILKAMNAEKGITDLTNEAIKYEVNIDDFDEINKVSKICLWSSQSLINVLKAFDEEIEFAQFYEGKQCYYEIINPDCNKGQAIKEVIQVLSLNQNEVMGFGDGANDIEMFKECGTAIAMANSSKELLKYADTICETTNEDGIYKELKRRGIIK